MRRRGDDYDERWFAKLDAIVTGREAPTPEDDDLLHVAAKLADALLPLNNLDTMRVQNLDLTGASSQRQQNIVSPTRGRKRALLHPLLTVSAVLLVLFSMVGSCSINSQGVLAQRNVGQQIWQASTSFEQIDASSIAFLFVEKAGLRPLLPGTIPTETQSVEFGIIMDDTTPQAFRAFTADYRITGQDVSIYEQATNLVIQSSAARNISIGTHEGHLFQDSAGNSILQWYQDGMTCQLASTLPVYELLALARQFRPITRWELIV